MKEKDKPRLSFKNRRASFEYFVIEKYIAGIVLTGTEIKSIRDGKVNLNDAFCSFTGHELYVRNMHIAEYSHGTYNNHEPKRDRKLLLNRRELRKLATKVKEKGFTIVPLSLFIDDNGRAKLEIALAKGKHHYDKREDLKSRDMKREIEQASRY
ncbi:MAG: SsrA-binding protein SmpB [Bacteroidetes bacterium]|nr:SsrA-binding protein SmpB [Bacteroidota bacterium]